MKPGSNAVEKREGGNRFREAPHGDGWEIGEGSRTGPFFAWREACPHNRRLHGRCLRRVGLLTFPAGRPPHLSRSRTSSLPTPGVGGLRLLPAPKFRFRSPVFFSGSLRHRHGDGFSSVAITTASTKAPEVAQRRRIDEPTVQESDSVAEQPMPPPPPQTMPPPPPEGRPGNICLYIVSFFLFVAILGGGAFFVLYITLPESENTIWFPLVGLALMATPWLFWTTTCLYTTITPRHAATERAPVRAAAALPPATAPPAAADAATVDSPGARGRGRVRFGAATVMEGAQEVPGGGGRDGGGHPPPAATNRTGEGDDGGSQATCRSQEDGSLSSHDSEMPLFRNR